MTTAEKCLIAILKHKEEKFLFKIKPEWLDSSEIIKYRFVTDYYKDNNELPGIRSFCGHFKLDASEADSRPGLYLRNLKDRYIFSEISETVPGLLRKAKDNPREVLNKITELVSDLNSEESTSKDSRYTDDKTDRVNEYLDRVKNKGITYLSTGNKALDELFMGYRKQDLVTFGGKAGSKKTWLLCFLAMLCEAVLPEDFGDILFITNEISTEEIKERMDAIRFKLPYESFLKGKLTRVEFARFKKGLADLDYSRIVFSENCETILEVQGKIALHRPSIVFIDGSYLLEPQLEKQEWERIKFITRSLKRIAKNMNTPIINTTQLKRGSGKGEKTTSFDAQDEFAYGSSFVQDSDLAVYMFASKELLFRQEIGMQVAKGRRVKGETKPLFLCNLNLMMLDFYLSDEDIVPEDTGESELI